jgi:DNA-binding NarL/FixJ family response regulator
MNRIRVLLADDHKVMAEGLSALLSRHFIGVGIAVNGRELLSLAKQEQPDIIVTDISMPLLNGIDALRQMKKEGIRSQVIVLTMHEDVVLAAEAFNEGARGFLIKQNASIELIEAITDVAAGKRFIGSSMQEAIQTMLGKSSESSINPTSHLTMRQKEILQMTAEGLSMKEIAELLKISPRTVESHKYTLMQILGMKTTAELVQYALKNRVI